MCRGGWSEGWRGRRLRVDWAFRAGSGVSGVETVVRISFGLSETGMGGNPALVEDPHVISENMNRLGLGHRAKFWNDLGETRYEAVRHRTLHIIPLRIRADSLPAAASSCRRRSASTPFAIPTKGMDGAP
jgi:hypothetical protein